jgi:hypothetical protein
MRDGDADLRVDRSLANLYSTHTDPTRMQTSPNWKLIFFGSATNLRRDALFAAE